MLKAVFFKENGERMEKKNSMNHIVIIGFKGSGKTRVGKALAKALDLPFVDVDRIIEKRMNMMVKEIYHRFGEAYYRALETLVIKELARDPERKVISLSYGLPAQEQMIEIMGRYKRYVEVIPINYTYHFGNRNTKKEYRNKVQEFLFIGFNGD